MDNLARRLDKIFNPMYNPVLKPSMRLSMRLEPAQVRLNDDDYERIRELIEQRTEGHCEYGFDVTYEMESCNLRIWGRVEREWSRPGGDGWSAPQESLEMERIEVHGFECSDEDGNGVPTDFDHRKI